MRFLFLMAHPGFARNFESTLIELTARGHSVTVALTDPRKRPREGEDALLQDLARRTPLITVRAAPVSGSCSWEEAGRYLRSVLDYLRYLEPSYREAEKPRARAGSRGPAIIRRIARRPTARTAMRALLRAADHGMPLSAGAVAFVKEHEPDVVLVTPLVEIGSPQLAALRAAQSLRVPVALCVASWDNLTMKGGLYEMPDLVTVWNEAQRREAIELHGVPLERIAVTGAVAFDHWFQWTPTMSRKAFCERVGLDPERPFVLYVGSSEFLAPREGEFVAEWAASARRVPTASGLQIMVRPHPTNPVRTPRELGSSTGVVVYPPEGANPVDKFTRSEYYDSLHHSAAVVGVNTTAIIEAVIARRPVLTVLTPRYRDSQLGTLHFRQLLPRHGGLLQVADSLEQHWDQIARCVGEGQDGSSEQASRFIEAFARPHGPHPPASTVLVDALERVHPTTPSAAPRSLPAQAIHRALAYCARGVVIAWRHTGPRR